MLKYCQAPWLKPQPANAESTLSRKKDCSIAALSSNVPTKDYRQQSAAAAPEDEYRLAVSYSRRETCSDADSGISGGSSDSETGITKHGASLSGTKQLYRKNIYTRYPDLLPNRHPLHTVTVVSQRLSGNDNSNSNLDTTASNMIKAQIQSKTPESHSSTLVIQSLADSQQFQQTQRLSSFGQPFPHRPQNNANNSDRPIFPHQKLLTTENSRQPEPNRARRRSTSMPRPVTVMFEDRIPTYTNITLQRQAAAPNPLNTQGINTSLYVPRGRTTNHENNTVTATTRHQSRPISTASATLTSLQRRLQRAVSQQRRTPEAAYRSSSPNSSHCQFMKESVYYYNIESQPASRTLTVAATASSTLNSHERSRRVVANIIGRNCHGSITLQLSKQDNKPFGFSISRGVINDSCQTEGVFISQIAEPALLEVLAVGYQLIAVNGISVSSMKLEVLCSLLAKQKTIILHILPVSHNVLFTVQ